MRAPETILSKYGNHFLLHKLPITYVIWGAWWQKPVESATVGSL